MWRFLFGNATSFKAGRNFTTDENNTMKRLKIEKYQIALLLFFLIFAMFAYWLNTYYLSPYSIVTTTNLSYEKARVIEITDEYLEEDSETNSGFRGTQELTLEILTGEHRGEIVTATNYLTRTHNIFAKENIRLTICIDETDIYNHVSIYNYSRESTLYLMIFAFLALIVVVGGVKGLKTTIGLIFTIACILLFTLPLIFNGFSPILISTITIITTSAVSLVLIDGLSKKVFIAFTGTVFGILISGVIFTVSGSLLNVSGFNLEEAEELLVIANNTGLELKNLLFVGVLIAAEGAVLDVAMSIASSLNEIHERNPKLPSSELFKSGINVGKDLIGTMADTLILAYTGSSFSTLILYYAYAVSYHQIINMDNLILEIIQALAGSTGIILSVPLTAFIGSLILASENADQ